METRNKIIEKAIVLFTANGYENVTMKDLATVMGCNSAEIYDYFNSKKAILEAIYGHYARVIHAEQPTQEEYESILKSGTAEDILNIFHYDLPEPRDLNFCVIRLVVSRKFLDKQAMKVYIDQWRAAQAYLTEVLTKGVELGRIAMSSSEIESLRHFIQAAREHSFHMAVIIPDRAEWRRIETGMNHHLAAQLLLNDPLPSVQKTTTSADRSSALWKMIECESMTIGRFHHYSTMLKQRGQESLSHFVDEIIENLLDELDFLYCCVDQSAEKLTSGTILELVYESEKYKQLNANTSASFSVVFSQIAELAQQHARMCQKHIKQNGDSN